MLYTCWHHPQAGLSAEVEAKISLVTHGVWSCQITSEVVWEETIFMRYTYSVSLGTKPGQEYTRSCFRRGFTWHQMENELEI